MAEMKLNKFFQDVEIEQFDYWEKFPERRRIPIVTGHGGKKYDTFENAKDIYDAGKLNAFIKVVNDKLYLATSWSKAEEKYVTKMSDYVSFKRSARDLNFDLFRKIFSHGNFFNIEVFKAIIAIGIQQHGIEKIIFKRMPYGLPVYVYKRSVKNAETFKAGKDYAVVLSYHGTTICVAMWEFAMPYH